jgi:intein-encoded DNA endonuclease-like protein
MSQAPSFCPDPEGEEVKEMEVNTTNTEKRGSYLSRELRIKIYNDVIALHQQGRSYDEIRTIVKQKYGIMLSKSTICDWVYGRHDPHNDRRIPFPELLEPTPDLAFIIGIGCGDGSAKMTKRIERVGYNDYYVVLEAKDRELVEEFAIRCGRVLNRPPPKVRLNARGLYEVKVWSKALYDLLKKPIDLGKLKRYIEHCPYCKAMFLRGLFDSEGSINEKGYIQIDNTNYELLQYAQELLREFGIETLGIKPHGCSKKRGAIFYDPRRGKFYTRKKDNYYLRIRLGSNEAFYRFVNFTIPRKREKLENYLRRKGIPIPTPLIPFSYCSCLSFWCVYGLRVL